MDEAELIPVAGQFFEHDVALSNGEIVSAVDFTAAAWCVAQLFIRNRSARKIHSAVPAAREVIEQIAQSGERSIEWQPMEIRLRLTSQVAGLFQGWPGSMLTFSERCGLSAEHFSADRQELPGWFETAIRKPLRKQVRDVTLAEVHGAIHQVRCSGRLPTKQAVADLLGSSGGKSLDEALGRRMRASSAELSLMLVTMGGIVAAGQKRKSSAEVLVRDAVAILMSVALERELELTVNMSCGEVQGLISELRNRSSTADVLDEVRGCLLPLAEKYLHDRKDLSRKRAPAGEQFFICFRGGEVRARSVQRLLRACMRGLDVRLYRTVSVFWPSKLLDHGPIPG